MDSSVKKPEAKKNRKKKTKLIEALKNVAPEFVRRLAIIIANVDTLYDTHVSQDGRKEDTIYKWNISTWIRLYCW